MTLSGPRIWLESSPTRLSSRPSTPSATPAPSASSCAGTSTAASPRGSADERHADRIGYARGAAPLLYSAFLDRLARFVSAVGGGCAKSLVIVLVAAVLFALAMSLTFRTNNMDMLTAMARYAAMSVVFVVVVGLEFGFS
jgi:hypothetical protein